MRISTFDSFKAKVQEKKWANESEMEGKVQTLASLENERDTFPPWVVDPDSGRSEGRASRIGWNCIILQIAWLPVRCNVLTKKSVGPLDWWDGSEDFYLVGGK
jgi:hypothetical protein